jgi:hypothetical protein
MADSIWWTKMLHKEDFCEHFCEMSDKEIVDDIRKSIASFMKQREEGEDFGAKMVHKAKLRIDAVHDVRSDAGKQGGRPRKEEPGAVAIDSSKGKKSAQAGSHKAGNAIAPFPAANADEPVVMNLAYSGEFGNVRLTQQEYSELCIRFGNKRALDRAIDSLSCQIENGEKDPKSHYAELVKWATYRDDMDEKNELEDSKPKMTNMEKSWISAMKKVGIMQ